MKHPLIGCPNSAVGSWLPLSRKENNMIYAIMILSVMFLIGFDVGEALAVCAIVAGVIEICKQKKTF